MLKTIIDIQISLSLCTIITLFLLLLTTASFFTGLIFKKKIETMKYNLGVEAQKTRFDAQEEFNTLISAELHDSISQLLISAKLQVAVTKVKVPEENKKDIEDAMNSIDEALTELRGIVTSLRADRVYNGGFQYALDHLIENIKNSQYCKIHYHVGGLYYKISEEKELLLYRICQESLNNIIKHAKAKNIDVTINYSPTYISISLKDDGIGFDIEVVKKENRGIGISNIYNRAKLCGAQVIITSEKNDGTHVFLILSRQ